MANASLYSSGLYAEAKYNFLENVNVSASTDELVLDQLYGTRYSTGSVYNKAGDVYNDAGQLANVALDVDIQATTDALVLAETASTIRLDANVLATTDSLVLSGVTAHIAGDRNVAGTTDALILELQHGTRYSFGALYNTAKYVYNDPKQTRIIFDVEVFALTDSLILAGSTSAIGRNVEVFGLTESLVIAEYVASISQSLSDRRRVMIIS